MFWVHRHYFVWVFLGLLLPTLAGFWLIGSWEGAFSGFLWGGLVRIFATSQVVLSIGSLGHMFGSRPFRERTQDYSANNWWISLLSFGECLQSNHHAFPASARHGLRWWEPDFNYFFDPSVADRRSCLGCKVAAKCGHHPGLQTVESPR